MSASPATPISFATGSSQSVADRREGLLSPDPSRHPLQEAPRQGAVQSRRPVVAGRARFAGQRTVPNSARCPLDHLQIPTWSVASCDNANVSPIWVSVSEN